MEKLTRPFETQIRRERGVVKVQSAADGVNLWFDDGSSERFDKAVIAAHGDQALAMLADPSSLERDLLGKFRYQANEAVLHTDRQFMPRTRRCWAAWNYRIDPGQRYSTHYWMNQLQGVSENEDYFVSINPPSSPAEKCIKRRLSYEHPLFDLGAVAAQKRLSELRAAGQQTNRFFCGAWQRYGFHEDGLCSAVETCEAILERDPWQ